MSRRRSRASASAPPRIENVNAGTIVHAATAPTASVEWVIRHTWTGMATSVIRLPIAETDEAT